MKKIFLIIALALQASISFSQEDSTFTQSFAFPDSVVQKELTPAMADSAYIQGDYKTAVNLYEEIIATQGTSAELYMNLGNAYLKIDETAKAILNYERASLIDPSDKDIQFNLEFARTRIVDKENAKNELFIVSWYKSLTRLMDLDSWAIITIVLFALSMLAIAFYALGKKLVLRKIGFGLGIAFLVCALLAFSFASSQRLSLKAHDTAIIMTPSVTVKSTPSDSGTDLFIVHEGRKVEILDDTMKEWVEISLSDGNTGWIRLDAIEII